MGLDVATTTVSRASVEVWLAATQKANGLFFEKLQQYLKGCTLPQDKFNALVQAIYYTQSQFIADKFGEYEHLKHMLGPLFAPPNALITEKPVPNPASSIDWFPLQPSEYTACFRVYIHDPASLYDSALVCLCGCGKPIGTQGLGDVRLVQDWSNKYYLMSQRYKIVSNRGSRSSCVEFIKNLKKGDADWMTDRAKDLGVDEDDILLDEASENGKKDKDKGGKDQVTITYSAASSVGLRHLTAGQRDDLPFRIVGASTAVDTDFYNVVMKFGKSVPFRSIELNYRELQEEEMMRKVVKQSGISVGMEKAPYLLDLMPGIPKGSKSPFVDSTRLLSSNTFSLMFVKDVMLTETVLLDSIKTVLSKHMMLDETFRSAKSLTVNDLQTVFNTVFTVCASDGRIAQMSVQGKKSFEESIAALRFVDRRHLENVVQILDFSSDNATYDSLVALGIVASNPDHVLDIWHKVMKVVADLPKDSVLYSEVKKEVFQAILHPRDSTGFRKLRGLDESVELLQAILAKNETIPAFTSNAQKALKQLIVYAKEGRFARLEAVEITDSYGNVVSGRAGIENLFHHLNSLRREGQMGPLLWYCLVLQFSSSWNLNISRKLAPPHPVKNAGFSTKVDLINKAVAVRSLSLSEEENKNLHALETIVRTDEDFLFYSERKVQEHQLWAEQLKVSKSSDLATVLPKTPPKGLLPQSRGTPTSGWVVTPVSTNTPSSKKRQLPSTVAGSPSKRLQSLPINMSTDTALSHPQSSPIASTLTNIASAATQLPVNVVKAIKAKGQATLSSFFSKVSPVKSGNRETLKAPNHVLVKTSKNRNTAFLNEKQEHNTESLHKLTPFELHIFWRFRVFHELDAKDLDSIQKFGTFWNSVLTEYPEDVEYSSRSRELYRIPVAKERGVVSRKDPAIFRKLAAGLEETWSSKFLRDPTEFNFKNIASKRRKIEAFNIAMTQTSAIKFVSTAAMRSFMDSATKDLSELKQQQHKSTPVKAQEVKAQEILKEFRRTPPLSNSVSIATEGQGSDSVIQITAAAPVPLLKSVPVPHRLPKGKHSEVASCHCCHLPKNGSGHPKAHCRDGFHSLFKTVKYFADDNAVNQHSGHTFVHPNGSSIPCFSSSIRNKFK
ncbi:hypothetical protein BDR26DRAFT_919484 [Obelidium mucronatum]|nr:hypothetical protein BDR26DRAFT_919484 [Obelidium mucronatum]